MNPLSLQSLADYWSRPALATNVVIFFNLLGALILGLLVGYERSYHGRAAGMRTYGLVCMASAAVTVIFGRVVVACTSKVLLYPVDCDFSNPSFPW